jgi:hypothetical protein
MVLRQLKSLSTPALNYKNLFPCTVIYPVTSKLPVKSGEKSKVNRTTHNN